MPSMRDLEELVNSPNETLSVEYKSWLNLTENGPRAGLAKHISALSNHGGGSIVFGFNDDLTYAGQSPFPHPTHDVVSALVTKYLEPPFQCDAFLITSAVGNVHPVIVVPPHGAVPICAKAGGPIVDGVPTGIVQGTYYVRKVGPSSSGIVNATEWGPVIRRCTMHDRAALLAAISGVMQGPAEAAPQADEVIRTWHNAAHEAFLQDVANTPGAPPNLARWHWQFTYGITHQNDANIELNALQAELERAGNEVRDLVQTGWSMFHVFTRYGIAPVFSTDPAIGHGDHEFLTASMLRDPDLEPPEVSIGQDLWRVSPVGLATIVRDYWEDGLEWNQRLNFQSGTTFDPGLMVRSIAEGVRHARALAERFEGAMAVTFRLEWFGLEGRVTRIPDRMLWRDNVSQTDHCVANGTWPATTLTADWATVVAALVGPVARAFGIVRVVTSDWILRQAPSWIDGRR